MKKILYILRGLPGCGKSTLANQLTNPTCVFEADKYFMVDGIYQFEMSKLHEAHKWCQQSVEDEMIFKTDRSTEFVESTIVVSNTNTTPKEMKPYEELAEKYGYMVVHIIVENRHGGKSVHNVPEVTMEKMETRFSVKLR